MSLYSSKDHSNPPFPFATSLQNLIKIQPHSSSLNIPLILYDLIDYLESINGTFYIMSISYDKRLAFLKEGIFRVPGSVKKMRQIRLLIQQHTSHIVKDLDASYISSIASVLKEWIREIPEGLVRIDVCESLLQSQESQMEWFQILGKIQEPHKSCLIYICQMLQRVQSHETVNKMSLSNLAIVFGPCIFQSLSSKSNESISIQQNFSMVRWTNFLLHHLHDIFGLPISIKSNQTLVDRSELEKALEISTKEFLVSEPIQFDYHECSDLPDNDESIKEEDISEVQTDGMVETEHQPQPLVLPLHQAEQLIVDQSYKEEQVKVIPSAPTRQPPSVPIVQNTIQEPFIPITQSNTNTNPKNANTEKEINDSNSIERKPTRSSQKPPCIQTKESLELETQNNSPLSRPCRVIRRQRKNSSHISNTTIEIIHQQEEDKEREYQIDFFDERSPIDNSYFKPPDSPYKECFQRILLHKQHHNLPQFQSMNLDQLIQFRKLIKIELVQLKLKTRDQTMINSQDEIILKKLLCWYNEIKTRLQSHHLETSPTELDVSATLKYEKQILKVKLHQFLLEFQESQGRPPTSPQDWNPMVMEYKRYKELRSLLK